MNAGWGTEGRSKDERRELLQTVANGGQKGWRDLTDFDEIGQEQLVNGFGGVGHEDAASEGGFFKEVGQRSGVVKVKVSDEKDVDGGRDDFIEVGAWDDDEDTVVNDKKSSEVIDYATPFHLAIPRKGGQLITMLMTQTLGCKMEGKQFLLQKFQRPQSHHFEIEDCIRRVASKLTASPSMKYSSDRSRIDRNTGGFSGNGSDLSILNFEEAQKVIDNGSERQPSQPSQPPRKYQKKDYQLTLSGPGKPVQVSRRPYSRKQYSNSNHVVAPEKPPGYIDENAPSELVMNFAELDSVPSETNLNKMFRRFGPLKKSDQLNYTPSSLFKAPSVATTQDHEMHLDLSNFEINIV
ncbi:hypothetical protein RJT34_24117 [Clitoria ternatea]|uniref:Uncharacterized protein n=1 Tax=Clitoria ternatea TaxID=43366 RepID=A0AAN9FU06_CLITE